MSKRSIKQSRELFKQIVASKDEQINLAKAALLIATDEYPRLNVDFYLEKLDRFGDIARERADRARGAHDYTAALGATLFDELGFRGNREKYFDPRNSFLNEVIDLRTGIPITLTVVYIEVARRIGVAVEGVGLPGHFICRLKTESESLLIDPFNEGRIIGEATCRELVSETSGGRIEFHPAHLAPVTTKQILTRMLSNLLGIYAGASDYSRAIAVIERILVLNPDSPPHIRDYGLLLAATGETEKSMSLLKRYLSVVPNAPDEAAVREQIKQIFKNRAKLN